MPISTVHTRLFGQQKQGRQHQTQCMTHGIATCTHARDDASSPLRTRPPCPPEPTSTHTRAGKAEPVGLCAIAEAVQLGVDGPLGVFEQLVVLLQTHGSATHVCSAKGRGLVRRVFRTACLNVLRHGLRVVRRAQHVTRDLGSGAAQCVVARILGQLRNVAFVQWDPPFVVGRYEGPGCLRVQRILDEALEGCVHDVVWPMPAPVHGHGEYEAVTNGVGLGIDHGL